ncbi:HD-GYP domain-containing protein [Streptomyces sp. ISL-98]|uniref:HD-GYP domain-containing protein n=1 Tax=Streptomyces sp. ISL-98 TaxID=2819192 RepID=UPI001BE694F5|nr:HD-GYP domain-containing protein [Streptomyces sp. ISL-98]MBT2506289.1 HD-GYP domain-containing protein [Streptomyces sp. ISL-98]
MRALTGAARSYILCALFAAACCVLPAFHPAARTPWGPVTLLAVVYAACELLGRRPFLVSAVRVGAGSFFPVLLAAVLLLPPSAAALVAVPGALVGHVEQRPRAVRRAWRAAQLALAAWAAAHVCTALDGRAPLGGGGAGTGAGAGASAAHAAVPDFPYVMVPAGAAVLAFCLVLCALDGGILATAERLPVRSAWRGLLLRSLAPHCVQGLAGLMMAVLWRSPYGPLAALFVLLPMYISCWIFAQYHRERAAHQATIRALVQAVDIKDRYTRGHSERVGRASVMIARELGMDEDRIEVLRFAGILHDVGKLGVPTRLLRKDGPLTPEERRVIELHPEYGHEMVRGIGFLGEARSAILHHHERLDGSGYPYGLAGTQIPEFARVVAVADAFDAMTSNRSYQRARPVGTAVEELDRCAGTQFDPVMVAALIRALDRHGWHQPVTADEQTPPPARVAADTHSTSRGNVPPSHAPHAPPARTPDAPPASGSAPDAALAPDSGRSA